MTFFMNVSGGYWRAWYNSDYDKEGFYVKKNGVAITDLPGRKVERKKFLRRSILGRTKRKPRKVVYYVNAAGENVYIRSEIATE